MLKLCAVPIYLDKQEKAIVALKLFQDDIDNSEREKVDSFNIKFSCYMDGTFGKISVLIMASLAYEPNLMIFHLGKITAFSTTNI
jgi:hypothetical protein